LQVLAERCAAKPELVVDVGGNFGWYTIYAAKMGCRVVTWEPVPRFRAYLLYNVLINNVGHLVEVRDSVVTNEGSLPMTLAAYSSAAIFRSTIAVTSVW
jgi:FkbM family methyltransferase